MLEYILYTFLCILANLAFNISNIYRYYELKEKDVIKFGFSTREYVLLHERSEGVQDNDT